MARILSALLLIAAALIWFAIGNDTAIAMTYSNSFCWLSPGQTWFGIYFSIGFCAASALLNLISWRQDRNDRIVALALLVISFVLVPAGFLVERHIARTTQPAVLQP